MTSLQQLVRMVEKTPRQTSKDLKTNLEPHTKHPLYGRKNLDKPQAFWDNVLWTDETKVDTTHKAI
uniref:Uncharacterized protein n=1 Tax=Poecilia reticulata TaxID=8081 RepID=A0A3P9Q3S5_POERE